MAPPGLSTSERAKEDGSWTIFDDVEDLIIPSDLAVESLDELFGYVHAIEEKLQA